MTKKEDCASCFYGKPQETSFHVLCMRYPEPKLYDWSHWCGEFKPIEKQEKGFKNQTDPMFQRIINVLRC